MPSEPTRPGRALDNPAWQPLRPQTRYNPPVLIIGSTISHYKDVGSSARAHGRRLQSEDTKLERTVALKFLAEHLLNDGEAKQRF